MRAINGSKTNTNAPIKWKTLSKVASEEEKSNLVIVQPKKIVVSGVSTKW